MRTLLNSFFSAVLGGLVVFAAFNYNAPKPAAVKEIVRVDRDNAAGGGALTPTEIYARYGDAVVHVRANVTAEYDGFFGLPVPENQVSSGSGFIVSRDGYVVTNAHVVDGADSIKIRLSDGAEVQAKLVGTDVSTDLALLKADLSDHKYKVLALGDSTSLKVGQPVYAIGDPLGYERSMSGGIVSALNREIEAPNNFLIRGVIQTDAAINRGNSGGPLISSTGKVIGVTAQIASETGGNIGIAFAIPSSTVRKVFSEIKESGKVSHPWIGIIGDDLRPEIVEALNLKVKKGAMIVSILRPGLGEKAGIKGADRTLRVGRTAYEVGGDIIIKVGKTKVESMDDVVREVSQFRVGDEVELEVVTVEGKVKKVKIALEERPNEPTIRRR